MPMVLLGAMAWSAHAMDEPLAMAARHAAMVDKRLDIPPEEVQRYGESVIDMLEQAGLSGIPAQYLVLVDRNPQVQAIFVYWKSPGVFPLLMGAAPVSTGRPSGFEHFETPIGVFAHSLENLDFRAEGTKNERGIRGYGAKGMRVYDFGWQPARKGWGDRGMGVMRLQMHASDPDLLEPRLGTAQSKGCIRIPATLNRLIDRFGLLDADYERAMGEGRSFWVLDSLRTPSPWSGRYLIVIDTRRDGRPAWSPAPFVPYRRPSSAAPVHNR